MRKIPIAALALAAAFSAAGAFGCAIAVGDGADLTLQALSADSVTLEDLMDAAWNVSETLYA
ncbi:hypothetical protein [Glycomyces sp. YM15]|uniref:hypothetical protein n=1 Tax=Glycomyces sp. YM15 TaxID=2800446 RepID=UPI00196395B8|nr:hypothetical protein [Glycomyces sp. YM15]